MGPMDYSQTCAYWSLWVDCFHASFKMERQVACNWLLFLYVSKFFCLVFNDHNLVVALLQQNLHTTTMYV